MSLRRSSDDLESQRTSRPSRSTAQGYDKQSAEENSRKRALKDVPSYTVDVHEQVLYEESPPRSSKQESLRTDPEDPSQWPPERILFLAGLVFFPFWILGAFRKWRDGFEPFADLHKWRCQVMLMMLSVIITGLIVVQVVFRDS
ncbi:hypothetical protein OH77DRAFT_1427784 [Trametes cingulata]|nr:hypothetical protein OH77DRAFT_1427784 [Trametes cingulata]